jgi:signal transduction histidine kinase/CheY-like chemotaxis protein
VSLPEPVKQYLYDRILERHTPFCMRVSSENDLLEFWGNPTVFGLDGIQIGSDLVEFIPLLSDYGCDEEVALPFVTDLTGHSYHLYLVPDRRTRYVIFAERRRHQQAANEVKLTLDKEQKVIAELVDAQAELALRRKEAERESRRRGEYIATMSHEFRTPITSIAAHAERLAERPLATEDKRAAQAVASIAHRQVWAIDNLLSRAKLDAEGFGVYPGVADVRGLVSELSLVFAPLAAEKALSFNALVTRAVPEFVWLDALHLRQVLVNLLGNAVKYTRDGSVELRIDHRRDRLWIEVADTGPGMDDECLHGVFTPFVRGRRAPDAPGAGLGLGISRQLVAAMGGELTIESVLNEGTAARFDIAAEPIENTRPDSAEAERGTVIVCDDDPDITDLLEVRLAAAGFDVHVAANGEDLVHEVLASDPRLVIVDLNMPGMDGASAARRLREAGSRAPIVVLSGTANARDIEYALASGCTEFVRKPPQMAALVRLVEGLVIADDARSAEHRSAVPTCNDT